MNVPRLSLARLRALPAAVQVPRYDPASAVVGMLHLGVGNFHRAHQAVFADDVLDSGQAGWAIAGANLHGAGVRDALVPQDGLYTVLVRSGARGAAGATMRVVGALRELSTVPEQWPRVRARLADRAIRIVTVTVTEKGYCLGADGALDTTLPAVAADLGGAPVPRSLPGVLAAGLSARMRAAGDAPLTIVSCDNLAANGRTLRRVLAEFVAATGERALASWLEANVRFPSTMVDRIVPATTDVDRDEVERVAGVHDAWPVCAEPFAQWVLEDDFSAGRPEWPAGSVRLVADVAPWEAMKLALLNAAHSALAYTGVVAGLATIDAAFGEPALRVLVEDMWTQDAPAALAPGPRAQAGPYCAALAGRFANPSIAHRTAQIAIDGSQKIPLRWLPALRAHREAGGVAMASAFAIAAWIRYLEGVDERGERYPVLDPLGDRLAHCLDGLHDARAQARAVLALPAVFGRLGADPALVDAVARALAAIREHGVVEAARRRARILRGDTGAASGGARRGG